MYSMRIGVCETESLCVYRLAHQHVSVCVSGQSCLNCRQLRYISYFSPSLTTFYSINSFSFSGTYTAHLYILTQHTYTTLTHLYTRTTHTPTYLHTYTPTLAHPHTYTHYPQVPKCLWNLGVCTRAATSNIAQCFGTTHLTQTHTLTSTLTHIHQWLQLRYTDTMSKCACVYVCAMYVCDVCL